MAKANLLNSLLETDTDKVYVHFVLAGLAGLMLFILALNWVCAESPNNETAKTGSGECVRPFAGF